MEKLTLQEWNALSPDEQQAREIEMPWEVLTEKNRTEQERLKNSAIEHDRKLKAANQQVEELNVKIQELQKSGAPASEVNSLEGVREQYLKDLESDPLMANSRLAITMSQRVMTDFRKSEQVKRSSLRKLRADYPKDMVRYGEELEDMLDTTNSIVTFDSVMIMFNSLRGKSVDDQIKEAEERGAKKALEQAGIVAIDEGGSSGAGNQGKTSLTKEQLEESQNMGLNEKEYKELLRNRQEKDKLEGRTPRTLISPKK